MNGCPVCMAGTPTTSGTTVSSAHPGVGLEAVPGWLEFLPKTLSPRQARIGSQPPSPTPMVSRAFSHSTKGDCEA